MHYCLQGLNAVECFKYLVVWDLKVTLVADLIITLVILWQSFFVLSASIAACPSTSPTVMSAFFHYSSELLGQGLITRKARVSFLKLCVCNSLEIIRQSFETFFVLLVLALKSWSTQSILHANKWWGRSRLSYWTWGNRPHLLQPIITELIHVHWCWLC